VENGNAPFGQTFSMAHPVPFSLKDGLPATWVALPSPADWTPTWGTRGTRFAQANLPAMDPGLQINYSMNFNLTLERQWKGIAFEGTYLGNLTRHECNSA
jgi:hypothetical protein